MNRGGKFVIWMCYAAAVAYIGYSWYTYSGLFRLAVEWQLANVQIVFPENDVARPDGRTDRARRHRGASDGRAGLTERDGALAQAVKSPATAALLGLVLLAAAAGAGWLGYQKSQETITYKSVDLSAGQTPSSNHAVLTGIAHTEYLLQLESKRRGRRPSTIIFRSRRRPGAGASRFVYFVKTNTTAYLPKGGGQIVMFSGRTPPFQMTTEKALLVRNGLPGPVGEVFRKTITLAETPIVLDMDPNADVEMYWIAAIAGGLLGFGLLLTAAVMAGRRRRVPLT